MGERLMVKVLEVVGGVAGLAGLAMGIALIVYRDFIRDLIRNKAFRTLSSEQATMLLGATIVFTFIIAILGIFAGVAAGEGATRFIVLVVALLLFVIAALLILTRRSRPRGAEPVTREQRAVGRVENLLRAGRPDEAERELSAAADLLRDGAQLWRLKAMVALAHDRIEVAGHYVDEALGREPHDELSRALKIKILLLSPQPDDRPKARALVADSRGISGPLDEWLVCLEAEGMLTAGPRTATELDGKCPYPASGRSLSTTTATHQDLGQDEA